MDAVVQPANIQVDGYFEPGYFSGITVATS
jgi:hypothetical protein